MRKLIVSLCLFLLGNSVNAATISLGINDSLVTINSKTAEARYRLSQTNWDQTIFNGTNFTAPNIITNGLGNANQLNGVSWDFSLSFESGNTGNKGLTFTLADTTTGTQVYQLTYDTANPINGITPTQAFNGIKIEARAGALRDSTSSANIDITNLSFSSAMNTNGVLPTNLSAFTPPGVNEDISTWLVADTNLGDIDWLLTGTVNGSFLCSGGGASCLRDESVKLNFKLADVSVVPIPGALWLFGTGLLTFAGLSRRRI